MCVVYRVIFVILLCYAPLLASVGDAVHRSHLHLVINDPKTALKEIDANLASAHDMEEQLLRLKIQCASCLKNEALLLSTYKQFAIHYPSHALDPDILEHVAWGIIQKTEFSDSPFIRIEGAFAACLSGSAKGILLFKNILQDTNVAVRLMAFELASHLRDELIETETLTAIQQDSSQEVQIAAITTLGNMRSQAAIAFLQKILEEETTSIEQKMAAIHSLVKILPTIDESFLKPMKESPSVFLRILACTLITQYHLTESAHLLTSLLADSNHGVRTAALEAVGIVASQDQFQNTFYESVYALTTHVDYRQSIRANWVLAVKGSTAEAHFAKARLERFLHHTNQEARLLAAAALRLIPLDTDYLNADDPYVLLNICIGLIYQRKEVFFAANKLEEAMELIQERISWHESGIFSWIGPTALSHSETVPRLPENQDFFTRLQLYSMLATCDIHNLNAKLKKFFTEKSWGVSSTAAFLLLQEGDASASDILYSLLDSPEHEISLQAACILALYTQEPRALRILEQTWEKATREQKEYILYAMGTIGSRLSLPFLVGVLDEPFQTLRIRASSAILQCLFK